MQFSRGHGRLLATLVIAPLSVACAALLGVEDLPVRVLAPEDAGDSDQFTMDVIDSGDGGCVPRGATFCQTLCPVPDFCEDFESEQAGTFKQWSGFAEFVNPVQIEAGTTGIVVDDAGLRTNVLASRAARPSLDRAFAGLIHAIFDAGPNPRGVRFQFTGTMRHLEFTPDAGPSSRSAYMFGLGDVAENQGVTVVFKDRRAKLDVIVQRRPLVNEEGVDEIVDLVELGGVGKDELANSRPSFELEIAPRELLLERQHACPDVAEPDGGAPTGMWLWVKIYVEKCLPLRGAIASPEWFNRAALTAGVFVSAFGEAETRVDDLALTYLR